ncbi:MAG: UDP-N-acetylmuramate dehydrogenase [Kiritimatiellales bacterium]|nr:UDP-N-acetylmuramate dehydrogenase [Kiritimatiellales bacterium]
MECASEIQTLFPELTIRENAALSEATTFRLGGPCPLFIDNPPADQLPALIKTLDKKEMPFLVIGQGSNLVISDQGLDCAIIRFCSDTPEIKIDGNRVTVSGSTLLDDLARMTAEQATGDLSYCTGIPGTVGGGISGNAGAFGRQIGDHLISAEILELDGDIQTVTRDELEFAYRYSKLKETGEIVLSAVFELPTEDPAILKAERERILEFRREHHPDWHTTPCAGSVFRNVEASSAAGRRKAAGYFLEEAGAKKLLIGGAQLYEKHANIIIGGAGCTAQDVWILSEQMKAAVKQKFDLELTREVRFLGNFQPQV